MLQRGIVNETTVYLFASLVVEKCINDLADRAVKAARNRIRIKLWKMLHWKITRV